jgi:hypothetical protein
MLLTLLIINFTYLLIHFVKYFLFIEMQTMSHQSFLSFKRKILMIIALTA